jgi:hypothetical protein
MWERPSPARRSLGEGGTLNYQRPIRPQNIADLIEQFARRGGWLPDRAGRRLVLRKLVFFFAGKAYYLIPITRKMPTNLLHLPLILRVTLRNRQKNFCLLRC